MRWEVSVVWYLSLPLMNILNKTEAAIFHCRLCFLRAFPFISFIYYFIIIFIFGVTPLYLDVIYTKYVLMCGRCHKIAIIEATLFVTPLYVRGQICMKSLDTTWQYTLRMIFVKIYPRYDWFLIIQLLSSLYLFSKSYFQLVSIIMMQVIHLECNDCLHLPIQ